jgi:hypothetical protein
LLAPPRVFILVAENEPPEFLTAADDLSHEFKRKDIESCKSSLKGHNHISIEVNLSSGEGEEWGEEVAAWIKVA